MGDTERAREAETQAEGEAGSTQEARCGTRSRDPRITPRAKGRHSTAEPPRRPNNSQFIAWGSLLTSNSPIQLPTQHVPPDS